MSATEIIWGGEQNFQEGGVLSNYIVPTIKCKYPPLKQVIKFFNLASCRKSCKIYKSQIKYLKPAGWVLKYLKPGGGGLVVNLHVYILECKFHCQAFINYSQALHSKQVVKFFKNKVYLALMINVIKIFPHIWRWALALNVRDVSSTSCRLCRLLYHEQIEFWTSFKLQ